MTARRRGLGRGLDALLEQRPSTAAGRELPITQLRPNRFQPRSHFDEEALEELSESIRSQGIIQPIVVNPDKDGGFSIVAGERRWRAAQRAGLQRVPVVVREVAGEREMLELALVENLQRSDLNVLEEAAAYQALRQDFDLSQAEIAERVGKARSTVANSLRLLSLPPKIQDQLRSGALTAGQARPLLGVQGSARQEALAKKAIALRLSARQLERLVQEVDREPAHRKAVDPNDAAAADRLTRRFQTRVEIQRRKKGGRVVLSFSSEEELMRLFELLMTRPEEA